jgi:hypothetical protein
MAKKRRWDSLPRFSLKKNIVAIFLECFAEMGELSWQSTVRKLHTACWSDEWTFVRRETLQLINQGLCAMLSSLPTPPRATSIWGALAKAKYV